MAAWLCFDKFRGSSPTVLSLLGVLTIAELITTGRRPGIADWSERFSRMPQVRGAGSSASPSDQFRASFPDAARVAALPKAPSQVRTSENIFERFEIFFRTWFESARKGEPPCASFALGPSTEQLKAYAELLQRLEYDADPESLERLADLTPESLVTKICDRVGELRHPEWPDAMAFSIDAVKTAIYGRLPAEGDARIFGLYAVVREARGWETADIKPHESNLLVRDLLWIRPARASKPAHTGEAIYFSAIEDKAYFARCHALGRGFKFDGAARDTAEQAMQMICMALDAAHPHLALLTGATRSARRHGAWKVLLSKLATEANWPLERRIILSQAEGGEASTEALIKSLAREGQIGAISSECEEALHQRWRTYKALTTFWSNGAVPKALMEVLGPAISDAVTKLFAENQDGAPTPEAITERVIITLAEHWPLLEPGQVILMPPDEFVQRQKHENGFDAQSIEALFAPIATEAG